MKKNDIRTLTRLALLVAIELVMKAIGLGSVPVGPLYMSFLTLPIAVGAITMGPAAGAVLGGVFGAVSFYDAVTGASAMTGALFQVSPVNTFILCVGMRVLMGLCVGLVYRGMENEESEIRSIAALITGLIVCYAFGTYWYVEVYAQSSSAVGTGTALMTCVVPFLLPDAVKLWLAVMLSRRMKKHLK